MKQKILCLTLIVVIIFGSYVLAHSGTGYWDITLPVMKGAINIIEEKDAKFAAVSKSYELKLADPADVREFYNDFFESLGWSNWLTALSKMPTGGNRWSSFAGGWSSYHFKVNAMSKPEAVYSHMWNAEEIPAHGTLHLTLTDYSNGFYSSIVKISITPKLEIQPIVSRIMELFKEPKFFFILSRIVNGNPMEIDQVDFNKIKREEVQNLIFDEYLSLVAEVIEQYKEFQIKYNQ